MLDCPLSMDSSPPNAAEQAEARRYGRRRLCYALAEKVLDLAVLAAIAFAAARPLDAWLREAPFLASSDSLRLVVLFLVVAGIQLVVSFPLSLYGGYLLERNFGLSTLSLRRWLKRFAGRGLLELGLGSALVLGLYAIIWTTGAAWWLIAAVAFFLVSVLLGQLAPVLILPLFYTVERLDAPELTDRLRRLAEGTGLGIEGVYRIALSEETRKANAALTGIGRTRRVLLGDTLLNGFSAEEIEVVFAHEIGHHVFHHIRRAIVAGGLASLAGFWLADRLLALWVAAEGGPARPENMPVWTLPALVLILGLFSTVLEPLGNALMRRYERQSDLYALRRTRLPEAFRSAFLKLARLNKADTDPPWLEVVLFHSHPPIGQRLKMAEQAAFDDAPRGDRTVTPN